MQFGLYTPAAVATIGSAEIARSIAQASSPLPEGEKDAQFDLDMAVLLAADGAGFDLALFAERHLGTDLNAWVLAGAIASRLERMRALVAVHPGLWHPAMTAKLASSLDRMCKPRVAINIVNGWYKEEFDMFGGVVLEGEARYRRSIEFVEALRGLWTQKRFTYEGEFYQLKDADLMLKPAHATPPEIFSVSSTDLGRDFIARTCDWWFVGLPKAPETTQEDLLRELERAIADMRRRAETFGRTLRYAINPFLAIGASAEEALRSTVEQIYAYDADPEHRSVERTRQIERRMLPATKAGCIGAPAEVRRQIRRFADLGVDLMLLKLIPTVDNIQRIGREVIA